MTQARKAVKQRVNTKRIETVQKNSKRVRLNVNVDEESINIPRNTAKKQLETENN